MAAPMNEFKKSLKERRQTIGCWLTQGTAIAAEIAATADFDWLLIDTEHSPNDLPSILAQLQVIAGYDAAAAVRPCDARSRSSAGPRGARAARSESRLPPPTAQTKPPAPKTTAKRSTRESAVGDVSPSSPGDDEGGHMAS